MASELDPHCLLMSPKALWYEKAYKQVHRELHKELMKSFVYTREAISELEEHLNLHGEVIKKAGCCRVVR